ncbi:hypothetical protein BDW02DRAFT_591650 [Decorospora gaudefroyi]|uniref:Uncharacterized protein n=1 Tax=Decorospora gaudefroyi TaxID=184978 RepID=A0A6A5K8D6_9PLEO|nr:hypothetical protein BDW02DRAFT_591650 [Decorospora gaudefroyi]
MPPKRHHDETSSSLKEKLQNIQGPNARGGRRNGATNTINGSSLKEVDNASTNSGLTSADPSSSGHIKWSAQDPSVLRAYRRAHRLDCPSSFKNPLSHVVLHQGIGRMSPTMARQKEKRRVQKETLALSVRKHFNAGSLTESEVIVDWLYKSKHQDKEFRVRFAPLRK